LVNHYKLNNFQQLHALMGNACCMTVEDEASPRAAMGMKC